MKVTVEIRVRVDDEAGVNRVDISVTDQANAGGNPCYLAPTVSQSIDILEAKIVPVIEPIMRPEHPRPLVRIT